MKAALYARFSSDLQKDRSIDDQLALCKKLAEREDLKVVATFFDRGKSGATMFERDGLLELMQAAKTTPRKFDVVIVDSLDRLSRDQEDLAGLFKRLKFVGIEIRSVFDTNGGVVTSMHVSVKGMTGSMFLEQLAHNVRRGQSGLISEGKIPGSLTYGYRCIPGKPGEREKDPAEAAIVKRIFEEYKNGRSPRAIADDLNRDKVPAPRGAKKWNYNSLICGTSLKGGLLGNPIYKGELVWNVNRTMLDPDRGKKIKRAAPLEDRKTFAVPHLAIVSTNLWRAANEVRSHRSLAKNRKGGNVIPRRDYLLAGLLRCGTCGSSMRIASNTGGKVNGKRVACAAAHGYRSCAHRKSYELDRIQALVLAGMRRHLTDPAAIAAAAKAFHSRWETRKKANRVELEGVCRQLNRVEVSIGRIATAIASLEDEPVEELTAKLRPLKVERENLRERKRLLEAEPNGAFLHPKAIESYRLNVEQLHTALTRDAMAPEHRAAFRNLIDSVAVHPTGYGVPYKITPYGRLAAILGVDLFPTPPSDEEILAEQGVDPSAITVTRGTECQPYSTTGIVPLGLWQEAA